MHNDLLDGTLNNVPTPPVVPVLIR